MKVDRHQFFLLSSILLLSVQCFVVKARECDAGGACIAVSKFNYKTFKAEVTSKKECKEDNDICSMFWCLIDGKKLLHGYGCYSDYLSVCGEVSKNAIVNTTREGLYLGGSNGPNAVVKACRQVSSRGNDCASSSYGSYIILDDLFTGEFLKGADMSYNQSCSYPSDAPAGSNPSDVPGSANAMKQMNGFQVFGIILLGFILAQFW